MGILIDSTYFIASERLGLTSKQTLAALQRDFPDDVKAVSVITLLELAHGVERADTPKRADLRKQFLDRIASMLDVHPVSPAIALRAGSLGGRLMSIGVQVAPPDLLIAVTALELGYRVLTANVRHFSLVPGLIVIKQ